MPFEDAKQNFETKTQKAPEKVEGNWEQFKSETKEYFLRKQKEVRDYIDKANYQDKENDKTKYLYEMGKALDDVIDGNEATKQEMADYKKELQAKSEALKNKLETESTRSELDYGVGKSFESTGLKLDVTDNVKTYLSVPWAKRLPLNYIKDQMDSVFKYGRDSSESLTALKENKDVLYTVFNYLCRGEKEQAETKLNQLVENLKFIDSCAKLRQGNDIIANMQVTDVMLILASLIKSGINKEKAGDFFIKNLSKLQKLDKDGFDLIMVKYPRADLAKFLLEAVIAVNEGKTINSIDGIKIIMQGEAELLKKKSEIEGKNGQLEQTMRDKESELMQYRAKNPQAMIDGETSRMDKEIAQTKLGMVNCMQEMLLAETKRDLVAACISGNMVNPSSEKMKLLLKDLQNAKKSDDLNNISVKNGLKISLKQMPILQSAEMQAEIALKEYEQKKEIEDNNEIGDGVHIQNVLNRFYKTGELKGDDKEIIAKEYEKQGQNLQKIIMQFSRAAEENMKYFTEVIGNKYKSLDEVPASEKESVLVKLTGQMGLLKNLYATSAKYLGVLESRMAITDSTAAKELQLKDVFSKLEVPAGIEDCKAKAQEFLTQYNKIGEFLGVKEEKFLSDYDKDGINLKKMLDQYPKAVDKSKGEYESIMGKYKTIKDVPYYEQEGVSGKLTQRTDMLKGYYAASAKYIGILESRLVLTTSPETKKGIEEEIKKYKTNAEQITEEHNKIAKFLGIKEENFLRDINLAVKAPAEIASTLMQKELAPYYSHINVHGKNIAEAAGPLEYISAILKDQAETNERLLPFQFDRSLGMMDKMVSAMKDGRSTLINDRIELNSMMQGLKDPEKYDKLPESMRLTRKKTLESMIKQIDKLLDDANLPFSLEAISKVKSNRENLASNRDKIIKYKAWAGVVTALTFCTAIGGAVGAGFGARALGNVIANRLVMSPLAASLTLGGTSMAAVSGGAALGSRFGMQLTSWADIADQGGWKNIWQPKGIAKDFAYGFALSVAAVGSAKLLIKGLSKAAASEELALRFPGLSKLSQSALNKMEGLSRFASPSTWFEGAEVAGSTEARRNFLRKFAHQSKEELVQESAEEGIGKYSKTGEFLFSVAGAAKGGARLNVHGIKAKGVGISVEGDNLTYTTKTADEFVRDFRNNCPGTFGTEYNIKINQDKSVTIELMTGKIDPKTGLSKIYSVIDVKPGMEMGNIKGDAEFARVRGLNAVEGKTNVYTVGDFEQGMDILSDFYSRGYNIVKTESGNIKISKGDQYIELSAPAGMMAMLNLKTEAELTEAVKSRSALKFLKDNVVKIKEYFSNINIKKSFQELVVKWQGDYAGFLENNPRLAKMLPADLLQIRFIPVPVIALSCGVTFEMKSPAEVAGLSTLPAQVNPAGAEPTQPKALGTLVTQAAVAPGKKRITAFDNYKPGQEVVPEPGERITEKEEKSARENVPTVAMPKASPARENVPTVAMPNVTPVKENAPAAAITKSSVIEMPTGTSVLNVEQSKLDQLGSQLEAAGLHGLARTISDRNSTRIPYSQTDIRTYEQREIEVKRLIQLHEQIKLEIDILRDFGLNKDAAELENYSDIAKYKTLEARLENAQLLSQGIEELFQNNIPFTSENAAEIIYFLNGKSTPGKLIRKEIIDLISAKFLPKNDEHKPFHESKSFLVESQNKRVDEILKRNFGNINPEFKEKILGIIKNKMIQPQDREVLEANKEKLTPALFDAIVVGGETYTEGDKTVRVYKGITMGEGGLGFAYESWYVVKPSNKIEHGVVKIPKKAGRELFGYEAEVSSELQRVLNRDTSPASSNVMKPFFNSSDIAIYSKITDANGDSSDMYSAMSTMNTKEWLGHFTGAVEGLIYMHKNGITHNDFKSNNIVIGKNGGVLIDFGSLVIEKNKGRIRVEEYTDGTRMAAVGNNFLPNTGYYHNSALMAHSIDNDKPYNLGDKFAVGTAILDLLHVKGYLQGQVKVLARDHEQLKLQEGVPKGILKLFNLAKKLLDCKNHPYHTIDNIPGGTVDPGYVSLKYVNKKIKEIAAKLPPT